MRIPIAAGLLALISASAAAEQLSFEYENFYFDKKLNRARVVLKVENGGQSVIRSAILECAFLNGEERALDTATAIASNIHPGQPAFVDAWSSQLSGIEHAQCRISDYN